MQEWLILSEKLLTDVRYNYLFQIYEYEPTKSNEDSVKFVS